MATTKKKASAANGSTDPRIDAYLAKAAEFAQPILNHLRTLIHKAVPDAVETMKWSMPFFTHANGKVICNFSAFKAHTAFGIWNAGAIEELTAAGFKSQGAMGSLGRITSMKNLPADKLLVKLLQHAAAEAGTGKAMMKRSSPKAPRPAVEIHPAFAAALKKNKKASANFKAFSSTNQRDYLEWIAEAKRDETRETRIATAVEWLAEGKRRNWKYES